MATTATATRGLGSTIGTIMATTATATRGHVAAIVPIVGLGASNPHNLPMSRTQMGPAGEE